MITPRCPGIADRHLGLRGLAATVLVLATGCAADRLPREPARLGQHPVIHDYAAPADSLFDPWGQHIAEAAALHDVPEAWIREVIDRESSGRRRAVSPAGAMGLMQVMPGTWRELRLRYQLGRDPFDPRDNILAGTAYIREMYERFGSPGFLAAYNAGPGAFSRHLARAHPLPRETSRFVAAIAPRIAGISPENRAAPAVYAAVPPSLVGGPRRPAPSAPVAVAWRPPLPPPEPPAPAVVAAAAPEPLRASASAAPAPAPEPPSRGFQLISAARAAPVPAASPRQDVPEPPAPTVIGAWSIQVGAFRTVEPARGAIDQARDAAPDLLAHAVAATPDVETPNGRFVRARLVGLSPEAARAACRLVERRGQGCFTVAPPARS
ncbi:lytic transglycosylase domain-containing protein [Elioraea tepidiphila]|jgi:hypothetical protein|uniref:lytic transglycosylase domain-containing protein n=1 Tax=Elioraea tepidiphila TaxID=457934 RepID=UPI0003603F35|nr:lytic transglycosylase domain-containing protein [Elioraea tepidiphila]